MYFSDVFLTSKMRGIIMFTHRIIFLTIMSSISVPIFSMQRNVDCIVQAAETGNLATIQTLDPDGANQAITTGKSLGWTPLCIASAKGYLTIVDYYVKKFENQGRDINPALTAGSSLGMTPLHIASANSHLTIVDYYVKNLESPGQRY